MSFKSPSSVIVVALVCGVVAWALSVHLFEEGPLDAVVVCPIVSSLLVQGMVFLWGMILRGTIRRRGIWGVNFKQIICPHCGTHLRNGITPRSLEEYLLDDWTCHECGLELSRWGRPLKKQSTLAKWTVLQAVKDIEKRRKRSQTRDERILNVNDQTQRGDVS